MDENAKCSRAWAVWWADVATEAERLDQPECMAAEVLQRLSADYLEICSRIEILPTVPTDEDRRHIERWKADWLLNDYSNADRAKALKRIISEVCTTALRTIIPLVDGGGGVFLRVPDRGPRLLSVQNGRIGQWGGNSTDGQHWHDWALAERLSPGSRLIFARCPVCRKIFALAGRQVRCSLRCTQKFHDDKRSGTVLRKAKGRKASKKYYWDNKATSTGEEKKRVKPRL